MASRPAAETAPRIGIRVLSVEDWAEWRTLRLRALADAPYAFSSTLAGWTGANDQEARWRARLSEVDYNVVADLQGKPAGMVSGTRADPKEVELISMWVAPEARGQGVGDALVEAVLAWAVGAGAQKVVLGVREANTAAVGLYRRHCFEDFGPYGDGVNSGPPERCMVRALSGWR